MLTPSDKALVPFVSVDHMMGLVHHLGLPRMMQDLAGGGVSKSCWRDGLKRAAA